MGTKQCSEVKEKLVNWVSSKLKVLCIKGHYQGSEKTSMCRLKLEEMLQRKF